MLGAAALVGRLRTRQRHAIAALQTNVTWIQRQNGGPSYLSPVARLGFGQSSEYTQKLMLGSQQCHLSISAPSGLLNEASKKWGHSLGNCTSCSTFDGVVRPFSTAAMDHHTQENPMSQKGSDSVNNGFVESWISIKNQLMELKPGSLRSQHVLEAKNLLHALRTNTDLLQSNHSEMTTGKRIEYMFALLDRLCDEVEYNKSKNNKKKKSQNFQNDFLLDKEVLNGILLAWLQHLSVATGWQNVTRSIHEKQRVMTMTTNNNHLGGNQSRNLGTQPQHWKPNLAASSSSSNGGGAANPLLGPLRTDAIIQRIHRYLDVGLCEPSTRPYSLFLHVLNKVGDPRQAPLQAHQQVFQHLLQQAERCSDIRYHPDGKIVHDMVELWASSWLPESCHRVEEYLTLLKNWYYEDNLNQRDEFRPTANLYCAVMEAYGRSDPHHEAAGDHTRSWNDVAATTKQHPKVAGLDRIIALFSEMKDVCPLEQLDTRIYTRVCHALSECNYIGATQAAHAILDKMAQSFHNDNDEVEVEVEVEDAKETDKDDNSKLPTKRTTTTTTKQKSGMPKPNRHTFNTVLSAYSRLGQVEDALALFEQMEVLAEQTGEDSLRPDMISYSALIWAHARVGDAAGAETIVHHMLTDMEERGDHLGLTHVEVWEGFLASWAESKDINAGRYVALVLQQLLQLAQDKNLDGIVTTATMNIVLGCYAVQGTVDGAKTAQGFLDWMVERADEKPELKPDGDSYLLTMLAWCRSFQAEKGERILHDFCEKIKTGTYDRGAIDQRHFNVVMDAWANSSRPEAAKKAMAVFDLMEDHNLRPNTVNYNTLMMALARVPWDPKARSADPAKQVEALFERMVKQWNEEDDALAKPDEITFNALLQGLGRSSSPDALERAEAHFAGMEDMGVQRNYLLYNTLMSAWMRRGRAERVDELF